MGQRAVGAPLGWIRALFDQEGYERQRAGSRSKVQPMRTVGAVRVWGWSVGSGVGLECGIGVWGQSVGSESGIEVWEQSTGSEYGDSVWDQSTGPQDGVSVN